MGASAPPTDPPAPPDATPTTPPPKPSGPPLEQLARTFDWVSRTFSDWYARHPPEMPPRFGRREFGFIPEPRPPPEPTPFFRHMAFRSREDFHRHLVERGPWHCYYSTAYYKRPDAPTMKEKEWLGADLIFDLDADHLKDAAKLSFEAQLAAVKAQTLKLIEDFLLRDFGFRPEFMHVVFSGGRGYHVHVFDPKVTSLESPERREIVSYVTGQGVEAERFYGTKRTTLDLGFGRKKALRDPTIPSIADPGWGGRLARGIVAFTERVAALPPRDARRLLTSYPGIGDKTAQGFLEAITGEKGRERIDRLRESGVLSQHPAMERALTQEAIRQEAIQLGEGETDEPVTADVKRLIRLPGSLHGKSGLRVTSIHFAEASDPIEKLRAFEPLRDAVAFGEEPVRVVVAKPKPPDERPERVRLAGVEYACDPGPQDLPLRYALFLTLRRKALRPLA